MGTRATIRTPDQRIRVFVSSTLRELEPERRAARAAIESLHLAPVMFELGARPHPPRELYRSYLDQSDIFVAIYGESYGWIAPEEEISGLEDEYLLSRDRPSLIYIRRSAPRRDARLAELLDRIRDDDRSSYVLFDTPEQLAEYVRRDLATLLADRFVAHAQAASDLLAVEDPTASLRLPVPYSSIVGRDTELAAIRSMLDDPVTRLITLVGPGGIGKSRTAIEVARIESEGGRDVAFAALENVSSPELVISAIARALGVRDAANQGTIEEKVVAAIGDRRVLLVVDNMEQVLDATPVLVGLLNVAPRLSLLVTSRSPLRVRLEHVFELGPLPVPSVTTAADPASVSPAMTLFAQRAAAVRPGFEVTRKNAESVAAICRAVEGVPLAIELAAARMRSISSRDLQRRIDSALALLVSGPRDLPERQRTLRRTIQWSVDLLDEQARRALIALAAFRGTFSFESAERQLVLLEEPDPLSAIEALIDASLLSGSDHGAAQGFRMLTMVRAFGDELATPQERDAARDAWIHVYEELAVRADEGLMGEDQLTWIAKLEAEASNLAGVMRALLDARRLDDAAQHAWLLYLFLWIGGYLGIERDWMLELLEVAEREQIAIEDRTRAIALYHVNAVRFWQDPTYDAEPGMTQSRDLFAAAGDTAGAALAGVSVGLAILARRDPDEFPGAIAELERSLAAYRSIGHTWGVAMSLVTLGRISLMARDVEGARARCEESLALARAAGERLGIVIAQNHLGWSKFLGGDIDGGRADFAASLDASLALGHEEGVAYGLEAFVAVKAAHGDAYGAGRVLGAAQALRRRKGMLNPGAFDFYMIPLGQLREAGHGESIDRGEADGAQLSVTGILEDLRD